MMTVPQKERKPIGQRPRKEAIVGYLPPTTLEVLSQKRKITTAETAATTFKSLPSVSLALLGNLDEKLLNNLCKTLYRQ